MAANTMIERIRDAGGKKGNVGGIESPKAFETQERDIPTMRDLQPRDGLEQAVNVDVGGAPAKKSTKR